MPRLKTDYSKTIIYKLINNNCFDNENIYVGSTTDFIRRKSQHKHSCYNENNKDYNYKVYQNIRENGGWENWKMIEIEKFPCEDKRQAEAREEYWRCELNARLNMKRAFITQEQITEYDKQYIREYRTENAEKLKEQNKQYRTTNAEKLNEYQKQYNTEHAEKIHQKYDCNCGGTYTHKNKSQHSKSKKHQNYINNKN